MNPYGRGFIVTQLTKNMLKMMAVLFQKKPKTKKPLPKQGGESVQWAACSREGSLSEAQVSYTDRP
jgi:hypothetical protein